MTKLIRMLTFGSCGVHDAPYSIARLGLHPYTFEHCGFECAPYALTSGAAIQLYDFCVCERQLDPWIRKLAYFSINQPKPATRHLIDATDIALVEMSSPIEPLIGQDVVNFNRIDDSICAPLRAAGVDPKLIWAWVRSLMDVTDERRETAQAILAVWPADLLADDPARAEEIRYAVEALFSRRLGIDDMARDLDALRERMGTPLVLSYFNYRFMPDGRLIEWPAGFRVQQAEVAARLNLPTIDTAPLVQHFGTERMMRADGACSHFDPGVHPLLAELMYDLWARVLGRPFLETYPDWRAARPELYAALAELIDAPARLIFPELAQLPVERPARAAAAAV